MPRSSIHPTVPAPTREEMEFFIRKGRQLQSEAVHAMIKSGFRSVIAAFYPFPTKRKQIDGKPVTHISGHHVHGS